MEVKDRRFARCHLPQLGILTMTSDVCDDARTINFFVKTLNTLTLPSTLGGCLLAHKSIRYIIDTNNKSNNINHDSQRRFHLRG